MQSRSLRPDVCQPATRRHAHCGARHSILSSRTQPYRGSNESSALSACGGTTRISSTGTLASTGALSAQAGAVCSYSPSSSISSSRSHAPAQVSDCLASCISPHWCMRALSTQLHRASRHTVRAQSSATSSAECSTSYTSTCASSSRRAAHASQISSSSSSSTALQRSRPHCSHYNQGGSVRSHLRSNRAWPFRATAMGGGGAFGGGGPLGDALADMAKQVCQGRNVTYILTHTKHKVTYYVQK